MKFRFGTTVIAVTHRDKPALLREVAARFRAGRGFSLATINLDHIVKLQRDPTFRAAYARQDIVVADGNPVVWLSRLARNPVSLVQGADLVEPLCQTAVECGLPISIVGSTDEALAGAAAALAGKLPGYIGGLLISPPMGFDPEGELSRKILAQLADLGPGLCLIALGAPKQERFAAFGRGLAPEMGFASVGAGVDFLSGHQRRAPRWMRTLAMEWLWRAMSAPRRLIPRYAACITILPNQIVDAVRQRRGD